MSSSTNYSLGKGIYFLSSKIKWMMCIWVIAIGNCSASPEMINTDLKALLDSMKIHVIQENLDSINHYKYLAACERISNLDSVYFNYRLGISFFVKLTMSPIIHQRKWADSTLYYLDKAGEISNSHSFYAGMSYAITGEVYMKYLFDYLLARKNYEHGLEIFEMEGEYTQPQQLAVLHKIGQIYLRLGAFEKGISILRRSQDLAKSIGNGKREIGCLLDLGNAYFLKDDFSKALFYYSKILPLIKGSETLEEGLLFANMSICYSQLNDPVASTTYEKTAQNILEKQQRWEPLTNFFMELASNQIQKRNIPKAIKYFNKAVEAESKTNLPPYRREMGKLYLLKGDLYLAQNLHQPALKAYHEAMIRVLPAYEWTSSETIPATDSLYTENVILDALYGKAKCLFQRYKTCGNRKDAEIALQAYERAGELLTLLRQSYDAESSKLSANGEVHETTEAALEIVWSLYERDGNPKWIEKAFHFAENAKATILQENLQDLTAKGQSEIPEEMLWKENSLSVRKEEIKKDIFSESQKGENADAELISSWEAESFQVTRELELLMNEMEETFPEYFHQKYETEVADLKHFQNQLKKDEALVMYTMGNEAIYALGLTGKWASFHKISIDSTLAQDIKTLYKETSDFERIKRIAKSKEAVSKYVDQTHPLYEALLKPVLEALPNKPQRLILSPDGILNHFPFELWVVDSLSKEKSFAELPYLANEYNISYVFSSRLYEENRMRSRDELAEKSFAGFAPVFVPSTQIASRRNFGYLPNNRKEVKNISQMMQGNSFLNHDASEALVKEKGADYQILHFATHAFTHDQNPLYAGLVLDEYNAVSSSVQSLAMMEMAEDGILHAYELYNLRWNADLVVLSACETGVGEWKRGEGVYSLARAFAYTGCPNIVMSLWKVDDGSTQLVMERFYHHLSQGKEKDVALQAARRDFLEKNPHMEHPYFWGAFVLLGESSSISHPWRKVEWAGIIVGLLVLLVVTGMYVNKKRRSSTTRFLEDNSLRSK